MTNNYQNLIDLGTSLENRKDDIVCQLNLFDNIEIIHTKYINTLIDIFGNNSIETCENNKLLYDLKFKKNEFILISFKSYIGQIPSNTDYTNGAVNASDRRRYNIYSKGQLWSDSQFNYGKNFYKFLDKLNDIFSDTPVNFISNCHSKFSTICNKEYVIVTNDLSKKNVDNYLYLPNLFELRAKYKDLKNIEIVFQKYLDKDYLKNGIIDKKDIIEIKRIESTLFDILKEDEIIKVIRESFIKNFKKIDLNDETLLKKAIYTTILYQYNQLPYNLYLFYKKDRDLDNLFTLMIAKDISKPITDEEISNILAFINSTPNIAVFEQNLFTKSNKATESLLAWKHIFELRFDSYLTFMKSIENVCNSICKNHKIKATISSRMKTFESFYLKLLNRANANENVKGNIRYYDVIMNPNTFQNQVFEEIRDIAGVRIVCTFDEDVWMLAKIFDPCEANIDTTDLLRIKPKYHRQNREKCKKDDSIDDSDSGIFNYRGFHITVKPGNNRINLIEYKNLNNLDTLCCEVQIRSNLSHGWSEAEHPLGYKEQFGLKGSCAAYNKVDSDFNEISKSLYKHDSKINEYYKLKKYYKK